MEHPFFESIAASLRQTLIEHYRVTEERLPARAWQNTLETNSGYVDRRAGPLIRLYLDRSGRRSLQGLRIADLGCGFGAMSVYLAAHGAVVHGVDPNAVRLSVGRAVAEMHDLAVELRPGRMEALPLEDEAYDLVVENNSLCYIVDPAARIRALSETRRILRPGGHLVIRNPNRTTLRDQFTGVPGIQALPPRAADRAATLLGRHRSQVRLLSPPAARRELRRAGFSDVQSAFPFDSRWPALTGYAARYQHLVATRPPGRRGR